MGDGPVGEAFEGRADRGDDGVVADQEMPVGVCARGVGAAGALELELVAGLCCDRPRARPAGVAVDDEVDRELALPVVEVPHGVGARARPLLGRQPFLDRLGVERCLVRGPRRRELDLDVVVGEGADGEVAEVAAEDDPHHVIGQSLRAQNSHKPRAHRSASAGREKRARRPSWPVAPVTAIVVMRVLS